MIVIEWIAEEIKKRGCSGLNSFCAVSDAVRRSFAAYFLKRREQGTLLPLHLFKHYFLKISGIVIFMPLRIAAHSTIACSTSKSKQAH